jgi:pimeloyl-ACP methyl ester carboxylesterase
MRDTFVEGEVRLAVRDHGGAGRPLVLVHGLSSNLRIWDEVARRLVGRHRVVAFDQRSHGTSSDAPGYAQRDLAADVASVVTALGLVDPVVVGHSWGASTALAYATGGGPCAGVVCVDGGVVDLQAMGASWGQVSELLRPPVLEGGPDELLARIRDEQAMLPWDRLEPVVRRSFVVHDGVMRRRTPIEEHMRIVRQMFEEGTVRLYGELDVPALLVLAGGIERSPREQGFVAAKRAGAELLQARHPEVRVEWLPSVHDIPLLHPAELAALIEEFVSAID